MDAVDWSWRCLAFSAIVGIQAQRFISLLMQDDRTKAEWRDPRNWRGGWLGIYVASRDPRVLVPKRIPAMGWTLNFAHRASWWWLLVILGGPLLLVQLIRLLQ
jgi:uncharacterized membrane protein